jgi:Holliday junction resolvasome RuvABC endonuclease subunit
MTWILGFDPSKYTGYSIYSPEERRKDGNCSHIKCGVLEVPDKADHYFTGDQIARKVQRLIVEHRAEYGSVPDFAVLEEAALANIGKTSADAMIYAWISATAIVGILANWEIPYATLHPSTWRSMFFGAGFKPPQKAVKVKGVPKFKNDWKTPAIQECQRLGVKLPATKSLADDAAEAVAISTCWEHNEMKFHAKRYQEPWMNLRMRRNERSAAA